MLRLNLSGASIERTRSTRAFFGVAALLFAASAAAAIAWRASMSAMRGMPMPGGWTMSTAWMRMAGQTWADAAMTFVGMWIVMMAPMMLPSLLPMLWRYRIALSRISGARPARLTVLAGTAYFAVWTAAGLAVYPLGMALAAAEMQLPALARAIPVVGALVVVTAGVIQFSAWKTRRLDCCRASPECGDVAADAATAWRFGLRAGLHCLACCANLTTILLVAGVMDLRAMAVVTAAITVERLAPGSVRAQRAIGMVAVGAGLLLFAQAAGLGY